MASDLLRPGLKLVFCGYTRRLHRDVAATTTPTPATGSGASSTPPASPPASTNRKRTSCCSARISASPGETRRVGRVGAAALGRGSRGILALTPRSGAQLIALALNARRTHYRCEGVYRFIRYLMYASIRPWGIAQTLLLQNWIAGWASIVLFVPCTCCGCRRAKSK